MCGKVQDEIVHENTFEEIKHKHLFWFPIKDIQVPEIFYKIQNFLRTSWASVNMHKDLLDLIMWM